MKALYLILVIICGAVLYTFPASSQSRCMPRDDMLKQLGDIHHEKPTALGITDSGALMEMLAKRDGTSWTIIESRTSGISCIVLSGNSLDYWPPDLLQVKQ